MIARIDEKMARAAMRANSSGNDPPTRKRRYNQRMGAPEKRGSGADVVEEIVTLRARWHQQRGRLNEDVRAQMAPPLRVELERLEGELQLLEAAADRDPFVHHNVLAQLIAFFEKKLEAQVPTAETPLWQIPEGFPPAEITLGVSALHPLEYDEVYDRAAVDVGWAGAATIVSEMLPKGWLFEGHYASPTRSAPADAIDEGWSGQGEIVVVELVMRGHPLCIALPIRQDTGRYPSIIDLIPSRIWGLAWVSLAVPDLRVAPASTPLDRRRGVIGDEDFDRAYLVDAEEDTARWIVSGRVLKGLKTLEIFTAATLEIRSGVAAVYWPHEAREAGIEAIFEVLVGLREVAPPPEG